MCRISIHHVPNEGRGSFWEKSQGFLEQAWGDIRQRLCCLFELGPLLLKHVLRPLKLAEHPLGLPTQRKQRNLINADIVCQSNDICGLRVTGVLERQTRADETNPKRLAGFN